MYVAQGVANTRDPVLQAVVQAHFIAIICIVYVLEFNNLLTQNQIQILLNNGKVLHLDEMCLEFDTFLIF